MVKIIKGQAFGECSLCGEMRALIDSHLIPKSAYKHVRGEGKAKSPIKIDGVNKAAFQTDEQIKQYLLCGGCEDLFNKFGEKVVSSLWRTKKGFPLLEKLQTAKALAVGEEFTIYASDAISQKEFNALRYFAFSVFWRAQVWKCEHGESMLRHRMSASYEKKLRRFLLQREEPKSVYLMMMVNTFDELNGLISFPYRQGQDLNIYSFMILGLKFCMFLGDRDKTVVSPFREYGANAIILTFDVSKTPAFAGMARVAQIAEPRGRLKVEDDAEREVE